MRGIMNLHEMLRIVMVDMHAYMSVVMGTTIWIVMMPTYTCYWHDILHFAEPHSWWEKGACINGSKYLPCCSCILRSDMDTHSTLPYSLALLALCRSSYSCWYATWCAVVVALSGLGQDGLAIARGSGTGPVVEGCRGEIMLQDLGAIAFSLAVPAVIQDVTSFLDQWSTLNAHLLVTEALNLSRRTPS